MQHSFKPSQNNAEKCAECLHNALAHTDKAVCDFCDYVGIVGIAKDGSLACPQHMNEGKINPAAVLTHARQVDTRPALRTDVFNSETVAIVDIEKAINADETITNKPYALAEILTQRMNGYKKLDIEYQEKLIESNSSQRAIQQYLNQLANKLRADEREKLKVQDINYKPRVVKTATPKPIKTVATKIDRTAVKILAKKLGATEYLVQMTAVSCNGDMAKTEKSIRDIMALVPKAQ